MAPSLLSNSSPSSLHPTHICQINALKIVLSSCNFPSQSHLRLPSPPGQIWIPHILDSLLDNLALTCLAKFTSGSFSTWSWLLPTPRQSPDGLSNFSSSSVPVLTYTDCSSISIHAKWSVSFFWVLSIKSHHCFWWFHTNVSDLFK